MNEVVDSVLVILSQYDRVPKAQRQDLMSNCLIVEKVPFISLEIITVSPITFKFRPSLNQCHPITKRKQKKKHLQSDPDCSGFFIYNQILFRFTSTASCNNCIEIRVKKSRSSSRWVSRGPEPDSASPRRHGQSKMWDLGTVGTQGAFGSCRLPKLLYFLQKGPVKICQLGPGYVREQRKQKNKTHQSQNYTEQFFVILEMQNWSFKNKPYIKFLSYVDNQGSFFLLNFDTEQ